MLVDYRFENMTKREKEIIILVSQAKSNEEISERLNITLHTVKAHMGRIFVRVNAHSRTELAVRYLGHIAAKKRRRGKNGKEKRS